MSFPYYQSPLVDLRIPPREGVQRRPHRSTPHNITTVVRVKKLVETTTLTHRDIAAAGRVDKGTVSRWIAKHGWTRPEGAARPCPRPDTRFAPNLIGRVLATRLRLQAERLLHDLEAAPAVIPSRSIAPSRSSSAPAPSRRCAAARSASRRPSPPGRKPAKPAAKAATAPTPPNAAGASATAARRTRTGCGRGSRREGE